MMVWLWLVAFSHSLVAAVVNEESVSIENTWQPAFEQSGRRLYFWYRGVIRTSVRAGLTNMVIRDTSTFTNTQKYTDWKAIWVSRADSPDHHTNFINWPVGETPFAWSEAKYAQFRQPQTCWQTNQDKVWLLVETVPDTNGLYPDGVCIRLALSPTAKTVQGFSDAARRPKSMSDVLATWPAPELSTLAARSKPDVKYPESGDSFRDILKVRDMRNPDAVPALEQVLTDNLTNTRIHGFAAAQALFSIGTPQALQVMRRSMGSNWFHAQLAESYTTHWNMPEPQRSRFVDQFLLTSVTPGLELQLQSLGPQSSNGVTKLVLSFRNTSARNWLLVDPREEPGTLLYLREQGGRFIPRGVQRMDLMDIKYVDLPPGQTHSITTRVYACSANVYRDRGELGADRVKLVVETMGTRFDLDEPGEYNVTAMYELPRPTEAQLKQLNIRQGVELWSGRVVSKRLKINLAIPAR